MGIEFLRAYGARRTRDYEPLPELLGSGTTVAEAEEQRDLGYEVAPDAWQPCSTAARGAIANELAWSRFVDGKDVGRTVAWLQSPEGYPVPVRLAAIGAVAMRGDDGPLRREQATVERVVTLITDYFPWQEVEAFALALREHGFRLLPCRPPEVTPEEGPAALFDFERMRKTTQNRSNDEMLRLERAVLAAAGGIPTVVDGRLEPRSGAFDAANDPVAGLIKTHHQSYLHGRGWRVFYGLGAGQRTPAFLLHEKNLDVVSWYLRLEGDRGELPNWGVVRLEVPRALFEGRLQRNFARIDALSRQILCNRCRDGGYGRAPVSIVPIQRAEESLGAIMPDLDTLASRFYRDTGL